MQKEHDPRVKNLDIESRLGISSSTSGGRETTIHIRELEARDPEIREKINYYLDQIAEKLPSGKPVNTHVVNNAFDKLKKTWIDPLIKEGLVPQISRAKAPGKRIIGIVGIASALYLAEPKQRSKLSKTMQKHVQDVVAEEYEKRQQKDKK